MVDVFIGTVKLQAAVDITADFLSSRSGQNNMMVARGFTEDNPVTVQILFGFCGPGAGIVKRYAENHECRNKKEPETGFQSYFAAEVDQKNRGGTQIQQS